MRLLTMAVDCLNEFLEASEVNGSFLCLLLSLRTGYLPELILEAS